AAELVLAQSAFHHHDAARGQELGVLHPGLGEEGALDAPAAILQHHEGLALAALADAGDLAGDDRGDLLAPAATAALAVAVAALARGAARLPQRVELAQVGPDQRLEFAAVGVERVAAQIVAERVALASQLLRHRPFR